VLHSEVTEEEALTFFEKSYRQTYLRLMVVVSGLYQQYNGKETYFWQAQHLTHHDYDDSDALSDAFLYVVSGLEDLKDSTGARRELDVAGMGERLSPDEAEQALATYNIYNKVSIRSSMSPESASGGFYATTTPRLGLARIEG
jgi:hypothetical protein